MRRTINPRRVFLLGLAASREVGSPGGIPHGAYIATLEPVDVPKYQQGGSRGIEPGVHGLTGPSCLTPPRVSSLEPYCDSHLGLYRVV